MNCNTIYNYPVYEVTPFLTEERKEEQLYQFLMGLNDEVFGTVRSNIIQEEPSPKLKQIVARIASARRSNAHTATTKEKGGAVMAFAAVSK